MSESLNLYWLHQFSKIDSEFGPLNLDADEEKYWTKDVLRFLHLNKHYYPYDNRATHIAYATVRTFKQRFSDFAKKYNNKLFKLNGKIGKLIYIKSHNTGTVFRYDIPKGRSINAHTLNQFLRVSLENTCLSYDSERLDLTSASLKQLLDVLEQPPSMSLYEESPKGFSAVLVGECELPKYYLDLVNRLCEKGLHVKRLPFINPFYSISPEAAVLLFGCNNTIKRYAMF